jgi:hypothetical protein
MSTIFDNPVVGVAVVVLASLVLFAPTIIAHFRKLRAFRSVSALNALALLLVVCFPLAGWSFWGLSPLQYWRVSPLLFSSTVAIWAAATIWSLAGKKRDS